MKAVYCSLRIMDTSPMGHFTYWTVHLLQYNTIFVYCEMTERSSTRDNNTKKIQYKNSNSIQYEPLYNMRWMKLLSHSLFTLGISCLLWRLGLRW